MRDHRRERWRASNPRSRKHGPTSLPSPSPAPSSDWSGRLALGVGLLLTLGLLGLHLEYYAHAGALWRDEVNSVNLATMPSFADVLSNMYLDSFPAAWGTLLHGWTAIGAGATDDALRRLGLLIGVATIGVVWWTGLRLGIGPPLVTLLLFGMSPTAIVYGDEVRGYGLAALATAWCLGAIWAFIERPTARRYLVAQAAAAFTAQTHYANCLLLAAMGAGAAAVSLRRRTWRPLLGVLAIGAIAAFTLAIVNWTGLVYMTQAGPVEQGHSRSIGWLLLVFGHALAPGVLPLTILWLAASVLATLGLALAGSSTHEAGDRDRAIFTAATIATSLAAFFLAFKQLRVPTNYWHYLSLIVLSALACDVGVWLLAQRWRRADLIRIAAVVVGAMLVVPATADSIRLRMTNLDLVAMQLAETASVQDLVVVLPWYCGITFQRYYRGPAPWITLPDVTEHKFHRHLEIAEKTKQGAAGVAPELARVEQTMRQGGKIWVVGQPVAPDPGHPLAPLPPAAEGTWVGPYLDHWEQQFGALLEQHGRSGTRVTLPEAGSINAWENLPLMVVEGWR